jgi:hypothetical protein
MHQTLVGRVERIARFGPLITDFNLLAPGALHRANGGLSDPRRQQIARRQFRLGITQARPQCRRDPHRNPGAAVEPGD